MSNELAVQDEVSQMAMSPAAVVAQMTQVHELMRQAMKSGQDYGTIPGCGDKPTLLKPGAEKLAMMFQLDTQISVDTEDLPEGHRQYTVTVTLVHFPTSKRVGDGVGICSTMESKYRFRWENTNQSVPKEYWDTRDPALLGGVSFAPRKIQGNWLIFHKVEHDNPADYYNTCLKMAKKRAFVDAILTRTGASQSFTQDVEDLPGAEPVEAKPAPTPAPKRKSAAPPPAEAPAPQDDDDLELPEGLLEDEALPGGFSEASGVLADVSVKTGRKKDGSNWTKYGLRIGKEWFGTFDKNIGEAGLGLKGSRVRIRWEQDGDYKTAMGVQAE